MTHSEEWRSIGNYENYSISSLGRVRNEKFSRPIRPREVKSGYYIVDLSDGKRAKSFYVHKLVAEAFIPKESEELTHVIHLNFNKKDNRVTNLQWTSKGFARAYAHEALTETNSIKDELDPRDIEVISGPINKNMVPFMYFRWDGKYYKVRDFDKSSLMITMKGEGGDWEPISIARLILLKSAGPPPSDEHVVGYKDFDKYNLSPYNLIWETRAEKRNRYMKFNPIAARKTYKAVSESRKRIIQDFKKTRIIKLHESGKSVANIAKMYKIPTSTLYNYLKKWEKEKTH